MYTELKYTFLAEYMWTFPSDKTFKLKLSNEWTLHGAEGCKCTEDIDRSPHKDQRRVQPLTAAGLTCITFLGCSV